MNKPIILDTHVIFWYINSTKELRPHIKEKISSALSEGEAMISSITLWEIATLKEKNRIRIFEPTQIFLESISNMRGLAVLDFSPRIAALGAALPNNFHKDPYDRIIVASTICNNATLITRDAEIIQWAKHGHIKILEA